MESNIVACTNILEACRHGGVAHLTYASTSSVYGANIDMLLRPADHPLQFGRRARIEFLPLQPDDVPDTYADTSAFKEAVGYMPATPVRQGVEEFLTWYKDYYHEAASP